MKCPEQSYDQTQDSALLNTQPKYHFNTFNA